MRPSKLFVWLLPLVGLFSLGAQADTAVDPSQALHLLSYLAADYPATVTDGKVVDESEYKEQLEFVGNLQALILTLPARPELADLEKDAASLKQAIEQRHPGKQVAQQARHLEARVADIYQVVQT
ncbi:cystathionine gamma-synthase, partial [Pseudomonas sp. GD03903]|nr:cystathionine gamma-synthase [Pseudomonas sp. GD03903]